MMNSRPLKLDLAEVVWDDVHYRPTRDIGTLQIVAYVAAGGGMLGRSAAEQPADFYIDARSGRLPYGRRRITQIVAVLAAIAEARGLDPHHMPTMPDFHSCGVF